VKDERFYETWCWAGRSWRPFQPSVTYSHLKTTLLSTERTEPTVDIITLNVSIEVLWLEFRHGLDLSVDEDVAETFSTVI
jgi:hypothetical protein